MSTRTVYLTGESRAEAYNVKDTNGAAFEQIKILHPFSEGGWGAWEVAARLSSVNLNSGPISGQSYVNAMNAATLAATIPGQPAAVTANYNNLVRAVANAGIVGGRQNDFTLGVNWYPDNGIRVHGELGPRREPLGALRPPLGSRARIRTCS